MKARARRALSPRLRGADFVQIWQHQSHRRGGGMSEMCGSWAYEAAREGVGRWRGHAPGAAMLSACEPEVAVVAVLNGQTAWPASPRETRRDCAAEAAPPGCQSADTTKLLWYPVVGGIGDRAKRQEMGDRPEAVELE